MDSAEGSAPSSREPNPLLGQTVSSEPPMGSLSSEHPKPLKPTSSNQKSKSHHREGQGTSLLDKMKRRWKSTELKGHEDLVMDCDLDVQLGLGVTCSRDTTVKVWSLVTGSLLHSLRGHTGLVTSVRLLPQFKLNSKADDANGEEATPSTQLVPAAVSGSQ